MKQDGKVVYRTELLANFSNKGITIKRNGNVIVDLNNVVENDTLKFNIPGRDVDTDVFVCVAGYHGDVLKITEAQTLTASEFKNNGAELEFVVPGGVEEFKVFDWNTELMPILKAFTIGG